MTHPWDVLLTDANGTPIFVISKAKAVGMFKVWVSDGLNKTVVHDVEGGPLRDFLESAQDLWASVWDAEHPDLKEGA